MIRLSRLSKLLIISAMLIITYFIYKKYSPIKNVTLTKITVAQTSDFFLYAPLYIAIDNGFFKRNGLEVTLVSTGGDDKTWVAVFSGNAEFGISDPTFVAISDENGKPGKVIGNIVNGVPFWGVSYNNTIDEIHSPIELKPYSVATFASPSTAYTLQKKMFIDGGLTPNIKEGGFGALLNMAKTGNVDIALELEPNVSKVVTEGGKVLYSLANLYGDFAITGITVTPQMIDRDPELIKKFLCSIQQALNYIHAKPDSTAFYLIKRFPEVSEKAAKLALYRTIKEGIIPKTLFTSDSAWAKAIQLRQSVGDIKNPKPFSYYVDNNFSEFVKACR